MDPLIARILAHRSAPETYDPPGAEEMMDRIMADAGRAARTRQMNTELPAPEREVMRLKGMIE